MMETNTNQTEVLDLTDMPEMDSLQALTEGCDRVMVVTGLREKFGRPNEFEMCKMVVLYNKNELGFDTIKAGTDKIMMSQSFSLVKSLIYNICGCMVKRAGVHFKTVLFKNIFGYVPNDNVYDRRDYCNEYLNGRGQL